jgi:hypothetical protein
MNGPSESQANSPVNMEATFSSEPFGKLESQPPVALPHSG